MGYIKKIFEDNIDEEVHDEFIKYGKGEFNGRYEVRAKTQKGGEQFKIWAGHEFSNHLVKKCLEKADQKVKIKGIIISTFDLEDEIDFEVKDTKKYMGMIKYVIDAEADKQNLLDLMENHPRIFYGISFESGGNKLKVKKKSPRSAKPGSKKKDKKDKKVNFCSIKTKDREMAKDLLFDIDLNFDEANISHDIIIDKIHYPKNMDDLKPKEIRENAKREGKIVRHIDIDGKESKKETNFVA